VTDGPRDRSSLDSWLSYLETLHPRSIDLGLERVATVATALGLDEHPRTITVAGTNGKGSCVASVDSLLRVQGLRTGVYTSPHLIRYNERIVIDGNPVSDDDIIDAFEAIDGARAGITLSYFESATLAALWLFKRAQVDWQVLEVGLGGRLDAVNIIDADACVITSIGLDHVDYLGDTRELIAPEKAGVARPHRPAIVAERDLPDTLIPALEARGANLCVIEQDWFNRDGQLRLPSGATYRVPKVPGLRADNVAAAIVVLAALQCVPSQALLEVALASLKVAGRQQREQLLEREWWFDVAHNTESAQALAQALAEAPVAQTPVTQTPVTQTPVTQTQGRYARHAVFGAMADKPLGAIIEVMAPHIDYWHLQGIALPRAADPSDVMALVRQCDPGSVCHVYPDADSAREGVLAATEAGDRIVVFGSFVTVGDHLEWLQGEHQKQYREGAL